MLDLSKVSTDAVSFSVEPESIQLQNRLGRLLPVLVNCYVFRKRYCVIVRASSAFPSRQLINSAEHLAHQLIGRLGVSPEQVDFFQLQSGEKPEWLRWSFQWVGLSPLNGRAVDVSENFLTAYLQPLQRDGLPFSLLAGHIPALDAVA